jgi:hypothetical protein
VHHGQRWCALTAMESSAPQIQNTSKVNGMTEMARK